MKFHKILLAPLVGLSLAVLSSIAQSAALTMETLPKIKGVARHVGTTVQLHVATDKGLYVSQDEGKTWSPSYLYRLPTTMVGETAGGTLYAFVVGKGLLRIRGAEPMWTPVNNSFGAQVLTQISATEGDPTRLVGLNQFGRIIASNDAGVSWHRVGSGHKALGESARKGQKLYTTHCQTCHGAEGVGETYTVEALTNEKYIRAPALDDSTHAWHHSDEALVKMILDGSQRTERMVAWKKQGLGEQDARDLVAYIKSLWGKRALECQGPKHMQCM